MSSQIYLHLLEGGPKISCDAHFLCPKLFGEGAQLLHAMPGAGLDNEIP